MFPVRDFDFLTHVQHCTLQIGTDFGALAASTSSSATSSLDAPEGVVKEVVAQLERKFEGLLASVTVVGKEDLEMPNHLSGRLRPYVRLSFRSASDLQAVRAVLKPVIERNARRASQADVLGDSGSGRGGAAASDPMRLLIDIREHDVPYSMRAAIDCDVRVGKWYRVLPQRTGGIVKVECMPPEFVGASEPRVLAWDIETTKAPLKFPDAAIDQIYMVSYMLDRVGFLLINREVVSEDVPDFEYSPTDEYQGPFTVVNLPNEEAVVRHFIAHCQAVRPSVYVTYNGDFFDWPFLDTRAAAYGLSIR